MPKKSINNTYKSLDMSSIVPPDGHIRMDISERDLFELSESMKEIGLIHAILVVPRGDQYEVVAGHRRFLAAKTLGWSTINAEIRTLNPEEVAVIRANENLQREGLSPIEEAAVYADLFDAHHLTVKMISRLIGKPASTITKYLDLLKLDPQLQKAIHNKKISIAVATQLHKIGDKKDLYRYLDIAIENGVTAKVAAQWTDDYRKGLQYIDSHDRPPDSLPEKTREERYFTMCQTCEAPMEYKDMRTLKVCDKCYNLILQVVDQGYFKEGGN